MMHANHSIFVVLLLLLLSPFLLCSRNEGKIVNGKNVSNPDWKDKFQAVVSVHLTCNSTEKDVTHICGGVAIAENGVLTAATCLDFLETPQCKGDGVKKSSDVHYTQNLGSFDDFLTVNKSVQHPSMIRKTGEGKVNLAMIFVNGRFPIKISEVFYIDEDNVEVEDKGDLFYAGWGPTTDVVGAANEVYLKEAYGHTEGSLEECIKANNRPEGVVGDGWFCINPPKASGADEPVKTGPCEADMGGPVFIKDQSGNFNFHGIMIPGVLDQCNTSTTATSWPATSYEQHLDWMLNACSANPPPAPDPRTGPSTGPLFVSPFLLGLLALVQFFLF